MTARFTQLLDWVDGRLDVTRARTIEAEVESDPRAREVVAWIREFREAADVGTLQEPPPELRADLRSLFTKLSRASRPDVEGTVTFDTRGRRVSGIRSPAVGLEELQHVVVAEKSVRIVLTFLRGSRGSVEVRGHVEHDPDASEHGHGHGPSGPVVGEVVLVAPQHPLRVARVGPDGVFELQGVSRKVTEVWFLGETVEFRSTFSLGRT